MILYFSVKNQNTTKLKVTKQSFEDCTPLVSKICNSQVHYHGKVYFHLSCA